MSRKIFANVSGSKNQVIKSAKKHMMGSYLHTKTNNNMMKQAKTYTHTQAANTQNMVPVIDSPQRGGEM